MTEKYITPKRLKNKEKEVKTIKSILPLNLGVKVLHTFIYSVVPKYIKWDVQKYKINIGDSRVTVFLYNNFKDESVKFIKEIENIKVTNSKHA